MSVNYPQVVITPNIGLSLIGMDEVIAQDMILIDAAIGSGGGTVTSVFGRTGAVIAITGDYTVAQITGAAPTASPTFTGIPAAPTAVPGTNTTQIATTAFVTAAVAGGGLVTSVFGRTGAVVAATNDYTIAQINGLGTGVATFLGTPTSANLASVVTDETGSGALVFATSPTLVTPALGTPSSGVLSSCTGYAVASLTGLGTNVATLLSGASSGTGGPAGTISPTFTSTPAAPTAAPGTNTTQLATTAFVAAAITAGAVTSITGTANQITVTGTTTPTLSVSSTFIAPGSIQATTSLSAVAITGTGILTVSTAGALSASAVTFTGAPVTGGSATTTFPLVYLNTTGATGPVTFSTNGTFLGFNAPSGFTGNYIDCHLNGAASVFSITSSGAVITTNQVKSPIFLTSGTAASTGLLRMASAEQIVFRNNANSADIIGLSKSTADVVQLGSTTASSAAIGPNFTVGTAGTSSGNLLLTGLTSGTCSITAPAIAGTVTNPMLISNSIQIATGNVVGWSTDTGLSRTAAGIIRFGNATANNNTGYFQWGGQSRVSTQFDVTSSAVLTNVTGLSVNVAAGRTYAFRAVLHTNTGAAAGGTQFAIAGTATATAIIYQAVQESTTGVNIVPGAGRGTALGTAVANSAGTTTSQYTTIDGTITVNAAGTLTVQFAQFTSNGTASSVLVGSTFTVYDTP